MIFITQLIYIKVGQESTFDEFERIAIPIILKYNGKLLLRIRPGEESFIENSIEKPYEFHFINFLSEKDFENFLKDEERNEFIHLKERSIQTTLLTKGIEI